jgi:hypothetical protein
MIHEGLLPRVLHFAGHGDAGKDSRLHAELGSLTFSDEDGCMVHTSVKQFIDVIKSLPADQKDRLECIVLNGCSTHAPLANALHKAFPMLVIISWSTDLEDRAGAVFADGFYRSLGDACRRGQDGEILYAVLSAEGAFLNSFQRKNPQVLPPTGRPKRRYGGIYEVHWPTEEQRKRWKVLQEEHGRVRAAVRLQQWIRHILRRQRMLRLVEQATEQATELEDRPRVKTL